MEDEKKKERRFFTRVPFNSPVKLRGDRQSWNCKIIDISLKGILLETPPSWSGNKGDAYSIDLNLNVSDEDSEDKVISMLVVILTHYENNHAGFHWENIDLDSFVHLRRLIELNMKDPSVINNELSGLGGEAG